ncbi:MAG: NAD(P)-binding domain-containing protein [Cognatishimia activa]
MSRIGFIGTGHIAAPMVRRMVALGHEVTVTTRNAEVSASLVASHGVKAREPQEVLDASEIVFICLRPAVAPDILSDLTFRAGQQIISVMAEHSEAMLQDLCSPATSITRTIPLGFVEKGDCPLPVWGDAGLIAELFGSDNTILPMPQEDGLNAILTASAFMASQLDLLNTVAAWTNSQIGDADVSEAYIRTLVSGFLMAMPRDTGSLEAERDGLTLPGSLNRQVMEALQEAGTHTTLTRALDDVYERLTSK